MASHTVLYDLYTAKQSGCNHIAPPANGGTIDIGNKDSGLVYGTTNSNETWKLPATTNLPIGLTVYITNTGSGTLTINNASSVLVGTVASGEIVQFAIAGNGAWVTGGSDLAADLASTSSGKGAGLIGVYDSGLAVAATTVEDAIQELGLRTLGVSIPLTAFVQADGSVHTFTTASQIDLTATGGVLQTIVSVPRIYGAFAGTVVVNFLRTGVADGAINPKVDVAAYLLDKVGGVLGWTADECDTTIQTIPATEIIHSKSFTVAMATATEVSAVRIVVTVSGLTDDTITINSVELLYTT